MRVLMQILAPAYGCSCICSKNTKKYRAIKSQSQDSGYCFWGGGREVGILGGISVRGLSTIWARLPFISQMAKIKVFALFFFLN